MGIRERNERNERTAREGLEELNNCFSCFCDNVFEKIKGASEAARIAKICESMELYAAISYEGGKGYLFAQGEGMVIDPKSDCVQIINSRNPEKWVYVELGVWKEIDNTGTHFSEVMPLKVMITWLAAYQDSEEKHVHEIIADIILNLLKEELNNLGQFQNREDIIKNLFSKKKFMQYYIDAVQHCIPQIPDIDIITAVSLHNYEKRECCGSIRFLEDISAIAGNMVHFDSYCLLEGGFCRENVEGIRKLLEIGRNDGMDENNSPCLIAHSNEGRQDIIGVLYGQGEQTEMLGASVRFNGVQWKLFCDGELVLYYRCGFYYAGDKDVQDEMEAKCRKGGVDYEIFGRLFEKLEEKAHHGALVIIAVDAKEEVDRLCVKYGRGIKLNEIASGNEIRTEIVLGRGNNEEAKLEAILGMANLDGAIFFDYKGNCHGFSVILDGKAKVVGKKKRGARYNSATNYIVNDNSKRRCAVIRSEDREKGLEIIPADSVVVLEE